MRRAYTKSMSRSARVITRESGEERQGAPHRIRTPRRRIISRTLYTRDMRGSHHSRSSFRNAVLMANAASAPSAAATMDSCTYLDASPATYSPGTLVDW